VVGGHLERINRPLHTETGEHLLHSFPSQLNSDIVEERGFALFHQGALIMTIERSLRFLAGTFVLVSLALGYFVHPGWYLFTGFVGLNLFQSAFTNWCPLMVLLKALGIPQTTIDRETRNSF
jgi:hypothetical protein